jgi:Phospholipase_D-nuclease N-terminal
MSDIASSIALQHLTAIFAAVSGVCIFFFLALFVAWLYVVVDILRSEFKNNTDKMIWFIFIMFMPPLAVPLYFIVGRKQKANMC